MLVPRHVSQIAVRHKWYRTPKPNSDAGCRWRIEAAARWPSRAWGGCHPRKSVTTNSSEAPAERPREWRSRFLGYEMNPASWDRSCDLHASYRFLVRPIRGGSSIIGVSTWGGNHPRLYSVTTYAAKRWRSNCLHLGPTVVRSRPSCSPCSFLSFILPPPSFLLCPLCASAPLPLTSH